MNTYRLSSAGALCQNSSLGQLLKWKIGNKYIKTSTLDKTKLQQEFMWESYAEVIVYYIAKHLGIGALKYNLCKVIIDDSIETIACESIEYKPQGYIEYDIGKLIKQGKIRINGYGLDSYNIIGNRFGKIPGFLDTLSDMILLDSLVLNEDRHFGNFGILLNKHNGDIRTIPIFDNGNSLFCHKHIDDLDYTSDLKGYLRCKPFESDFDRQLELINITEEKLQHLIDLKKYIPALLSRMKNQGLDIHRAKFIKDLLNDRIDAIIRLKT